MSTKKPYPRNGSLKTRQRTSPVPRLRNHPSSRTSPPSRAGSASVRSSAKPPPLPSRSAKQNTRFYDNDDDDDDDEEYEEDDDEIHHLPKEEKWIEYRSSDGQTIVLNPSSKVVRLSEADLIGEDAFTVRADRWYDGETEQGQNLGMDIESVVESLSIVMEKFEKVYSFEDQLSSEIVESLKHISGRVKSVHEVLEEGKMAFEEGNDVEVLLTQKKSDWKFDNDHVAWYRKLAANRNYDMFAYKKWHFPEYLSDSPIPAELARKTKGEIILPEIPGFGKQRKDVTVDIDPRDLVGKAISKAFSKIKGTAGKESEYCLKSIGFCEYLHGSRQFGEYSYVRCCLRDQLKLNFLLVKIPKEYTQIQKDLIPCADPILKNQMTTVETYSHLTLNKPWTAKTITHIPMCDLSIPFRCQVIGIDFINAKTIPRLGNYDIKQIFLEVFLFYGATKLQAHQGPTRRIPLTNAARWYKTLHCSKNSPGLLLNSIPREARMGFILWGTTSVEETQNEEEFIRLGWVVQQLVDRYGELSQGEVNLNMWCFPGVKKDKHKVRKLDPDFIFRATNRDCQKKLQKCAVLRLKFDEYLHPVVSPVCPKYRKPDVKIVGGKYRIPPKKDKKNKDLKMLINEDSLYVLTSANKDLIWNLRHSLIRYPGMLSKFLQCVQWGNVDHKNEAYRLLDLWSPPFTMANVIELLDVKFPDYRVRRYAVNCLRRLEDDELQLYLLQFTQCLKFESYHDSPLSRFLIERAVRNPYLIGHYFFWHLKAELVDPGFTERCNVILEEFLMNCGRFSAELRKQNFAVLKMQRVSGMIVRLKRDGVRDVDVMKEYHKEMLKLNSNFFSKIGKFQVPLNPKWEATELIIEKCSYMSSKMVPLWLVFKNADPNADKIYVIFKSGDDLRQDILTLQLLRIMDRMWLANGLDMRLKPYKVIATGINEHGDGVGMIEVVLGSDTTSDIQIKMGGGAMGALKLQPIADYIKKHNEGEKHAEAIKNFVCSCAGYCVATYVLGIGDRHNGNIMVTKDGHLFHIDFGHFLGNFKSKFGIKRERAAFVFTPEMAFVMGGKNYRNSPEYKEFMDLCFKGYTVVRQNARIIETLFILMVSAGMPELMVESDVLYLKNMLHLTLDEEKAQKRFEAEIKKSLQSSYRRFDNMIHNLVHG